jgi:hypothetical protein
MRNDDKEQKGLEILDTDNLDIFVTECNKLPERFKSQYITEKNGLTCLILQVGDKIPKFDEFKDKYKIEGKTYFESLQLAFVRTLGFDDDEHFAEWLGANPQWAQENWCGGSTDIFNNSEHQGFASANATTYDELINKLCELHDTYNFLVYDNA